MTSSVSFLLLRTDMKSNADILAGEQGKKPLPQLLKQLDNHSEVSYALGIKNEKKNILQQGSSFKKFCVLATITITFSSPYLIRSTLVHIFACRERKIVFLAHYLYR